MAESSTAAEEAEKAHRIAGYLESSVQSNTSKARKSYKLRRYTHPSCQPNPIAPIIHHHHHQNPLLYP